ncbi:GNAT family N-acetyltransferase [Saccharibacillus sp. O23]|uniref:GNAT family N-acetyltransferase n=1 Tax=Saccharibacillus sp. O23 TaxID=2009338 RepID=UPI000B4E287A|nr:GNAT family N-acetyltransferase [Saccharibacillus sp. O23]OWR27260.1 GNAT family N-acetyltransferase [Saccharibacillus sp. O23]
MIHLKKIGAENIKECLALQVGEDQQRWVRSAAESLALAYVHQETAVPFAIYADEQMVGFVMLRRNKEFRNVLLWQFLIDRRYQARGYGKAAIRSVIEWVRQNTDYREIVVSCYEDNTNAIKLYRGLGFRDLGEPDPVHREIDFILQW